MFVNAIVPEEPSEEYRTPPLIGGDERLHAFLQKKQLPAAAGCNISEERRVLGDDRIGESSSRLVPYPCHASVRSDVAFHDRIGNLQPRPKVLIKYAPSPIHGLIPVVTFACHVEMDRACKRTYLKNLEFVIVMAVWRVMTAAPLPSTELRSKIQSFTLHTMK